MEFFQEIDRAQKTTRQDIERGLAALETLFSESQLDAADIAKYSALKIEFMIDLKQVELYELELQNFSGGNAKFQLPTNRVAAALLITKQPFPKSVKQNKPVESGGVTVRLLTGALSQNAWNSGTLIKAEVCSDYSAKPKKNPMTVKNNVKELENGSAIFNVLLLSSSFSKSTTYLLEHIPEHSFLYSFPYSFPFSLLCIIFPRNFYSPLELERNQFKLNLKWTFKLGIFQGLLKVTFLSLSLLKLMKISGKR